MIRSGEGISVSGTHDPFIEFGIAASLGQFAVKQDAIDFVKVGLVKG